MATTKSRPKHSAFEGATIGAAVPDNSRMVKHKDGTVSFVKKSTKSKKK